MIRLGRPNAARGLDILPRLLARKQRKQSREDASLVDVAIRTALLHADALGVLPLRHDGGHNGIRDQVARDNHFLHHHVHRHVEIHGSPQQELRRPCLAYGVGGRAGDSARSANHPLVCERPALIVLAQWHKGVIVDEPDVVVLVGLVALTEGEDVPVATEPRVVIGCFRAFIPGYCFRRPRRVMKLRRVDLSQELSKVVIQIGHNFANINVPRRIRLDDEKGRELLSEHGRPYLHER